MLILRRGREWKVSCLGCHLGSTAWWQLATVELSTPPLSEIYETTAFCVVGPVDGGEMLCRDVRDRSRATIQYRGVHPVEHADSGRRRKCSLASQRIPG